jgi:hypothetical protein
MNDKLARLAARRQQLVTQAADQRTALAHDLEPWRARLALADRGVAVFCYIRRHPVLIAGAALLLAALRTRHIGTWLERGVLMWQIGRRFRQKSSIRETG